MTEWQSFMLGMLLAGIVCLLVILVRQLDRVIALLRHLAERPRQE